MPDVFEGRNRLDPEAGVQAGTDRSGFAMSSPTIEQESD